MAGKRIARGVRRLGPGRYEFRAMRDGLTVSNVFHIATDGEAKRLRRQWEADLDSGRVAPAGDSLSEVLDRWLALKRTQDLSPTTLALYSGTAQKHIKPRLGSEPVNRISSQDLDRFYALLLHDGVGKVTVHKAHLILHGCFRQASRWGLVIINPAENATPPHPPAPQTAEKTPTLAQVLRLYEAALDHDPTFAPLIRLAAATGARRGELVALRWSDVDFTERTIHIRQGVVRVDGGILLKEPKSGRARRVAVDDQTLTVLRTHRRGAAERALGSGQRLTDSSFLFSSMPGAAQPWRPETVTQRFNKLAKEIGAPNLTLHGLRHFHITQLISAGEDIVTVSKRVGHARPSITTDIYSHALPERDRQVAERLGRIMEQSV